MSKASSINRATAIEVAGPGREADRGSPTAGRPVRVLCVDDHAVLIEGLAARFAVNGELEVVGRLSSAARLVEEVGRLQPDVVLLDIEMPGPDAFEAADRLHRRHPTVKVVVLSAHVRDSFVAASRRVGACAYFAKADNLDDIIRGIYAAVRSEPGAFILGPKVEERCHSATAGRAAPNGNAVTPSDTLTPREQEILRLIGKGLSRNQIAAQLSRSVKTIDAHQSRMMKKLGMTARADVIRFAIREGFSQA